MSRFVVVAAAAATALTIAARRAVADAAMTTDLLDRLRPPSWSNPLGTDHLGRDVAARLIHGGAGSLALAGIVLAASAAAGTALGVIAAFRPRVLGGIIRSASDATVALPAVVVALALAGTIGGGTTAVVVAGVAVGWTPYCRLTDRLATTILTEDYVEAARAAGASAWRLAWHHVLANAAAPLVGHVAVRAAQSLLAVSGLSYLGLGPQPPSADWGASLAATQPYLERAPWAVLAPGGAIAVTALIVMACGRTFARRVDPVGARAPVARA
jgi:peptide/nickel transport system permease protein